MAEPTAAEIIEAVLVAHRRNVSFSTVLCDCVCGMRVDDSAAHACHQTHKLLGELAVQGFAVVRVSELAVATGQKGGRDYRDV